MGVWVGICFGIAFVTGLISHYAQAGNQPIPFPTSPAWGYRLTQGLHVVAGTAAIPLLLVKLWTVYPKLFQARPRGVREAVRTGLERASIAVLVAGSIMELGIGVMNVAHWYAWRFDFRRTHYALAWIVIGALLIHIAVKLPVIRSALSSDIEATGLDRDDAVEAGVLSRRQLVRTAWLSAVVAIVSLALLGVLGAIAARTGGAKMLPGTVRVLFWGALAMAVTAGLGRLFGAVA